MSCSHKAESWGEHGDEGHGVRESGGQVQASHLVAGQPWVNHLTSLNFYTLLDQMGMTIYIKHIFRLTS